MLTLDTLLGHVLHKVTYELYCMNSRCREKRLKFEPSQKFYEHYKPGLSIGDSCDGKNKCSDKERVEEIYLYPSSQPHNLYAVTYKLHCRGGVSSGDPPMCWERQAGIVFLSNSVGQK